MELRVKEICKEKGVLMEELANKLGIARVNLTKTINGNPTVGTLERIAEALDVDFMDLFVKNEKGEVNGYIELDGTIHKVSSKEDIIIVAANSLIQRNIEKTWKPEIGEKYWYVSVPLSWNFEECHPKDAVREDNGTRIFEGNNYFKTEDEAIEVTNVLRRLFGYPQYKEDIKKLAEKL